jgi:CarboxypepD_reg-like domain
MIWACLLFVASADETFGFNARGSRGAQRIESAFVLPPLSLTTGYQFGFFAASDFLLAGDAHVRQQHQLLATFVPLRFLEMSLGARITLDSNAGPPDAPFSSPQTQTVGDPNIAVKFGHRLPANLAAGAWLQLMFPTSLSGRGLRADALQLWAQALLSWTPFDVLEASINVGYLWDNTGRLFGASAGVMERFSAGMSFASLFTAGVALSTAFVLGDLVGLGPFAELSAGFASTASRTQQPIRTTLGLKVFPKRHPFELALGTDIRVNGAPDPNGPLPGLPPWEFFARFVVNLRPTPLPASEGVVTKEVIKEVVREVTREPAVFTIAGSVTDGQKPIIGAAVVIDGKVSALATDDNGLYKSFALPAGEGLMKIKAAAAGYRNAEQTIARGRNGQIVSCEFVLTPLDRSETGVVRGNLKDGRSGQPIAGEIFLPSLGKKVSTDAKGHFELTVANGRYVLLISSRGYVTQKKDVDIRPGAVLIFNVDLLR